MKNTKKILIIILLVTICIIAYIFIKIANPTIRGVVIKVNDKNLTFMDAKDGSLYSTTIPQNSNLQFKQYQEIFVYLEHDAFIDQSSINTIKNGSIKKIKILKEKSNIKVPNKKLERVYSSPDKVLVTINELSPTGISITVNDTNEFKHEYQYSDSYRISKGKHNEGYRALTKNNNIKTSVNSVRVNNNGAIKNTYKWENIYGKLESGDYEFQTSTSDSYIIIFIQFTIGENGKITYSKVECNFLIF